jgi:hypothetical protein
MQRDKTEEVMSDQKQKSVLSLVQRVLDGLTLHASGSSKDVCSDGIGVMCSHLSHSRESFVLRL